MSIVIIQHAFRFQSHVLTENDVDLSLSSPFQGYFTEYVVPIRMMTIKTLKWAF